MVRFVTFGGLNPPPYHLDPSPYHLNPPHYHQVLRGGDPLPWFLCCGLGFDRRRTRCHSWWRRCLLGLRWIKVDILKQFSVLTSKCLVAVRKRSLEDFVKPTVKSGLWAISSESSLTPTTRPSVSRNHFSGKASGWVGYCGAASECGKSRGRVETTSERPNPPALLLPDLQICAEFNKVSKNMTLA